MPPFVGHPAAAPAVSSQRFLETGVPFGGLLRLRKPSSDAACARVVRFPQRPNFPKAAVRVQAVGFSGRLSSSHARRRAGVCAAAAWTARCAAEQTQTVTRQSSTITVAPIQGKEKSPELDDGGTGFPPRDDDGGGGGGGGGGPNWSGGFFFFGLLAFLGFLKDKENEAPYKSDRERYAY